MYRHARSDHLGAEKYAAHSAVSETVALLAAIDTHRTQLAEAVCVGLNHLRIVECESWERRRGNILGSMRFRYNQTMCYILFE